MYMEIISKVFWYFKVFPGILTIFARFYVTLPRLNSQKTPKPTVKFLKILSKVLLQLPLWLDIH